MKTDRTSLKRLPYRGHHDLATINAILDDNYLCHVACNVYGQLRCIPTAYGRGGDYLYLHGSVKSPLLMALASGVEACITVTEINAIVLARSLFHSSMNYRSVMIVGNAESVTSDEEKMNGLRVVTESIWKGRWNEARLPTPGELSATSVVRIPITEGSAKIRTGPAVDNKEDYDLPIWAGLVPVNTQFGKPIPDEALDSEVPLPSSFKSASATE